MSNVAESITVTEDGLRIPVIEILTGRGFITGKSGSGKSNTASVVAEELLENGFPLLIVDTDGEYVGLRERYEMLHVGTDDDCDVEATPEEADHVVSLALEDNQPVILDISGIVEADETSQVVSAFVRSLFAKEKEVRKPFLLIVEEMHEFVPEQGGLDDLGELLIRVGKRGRKRGLGICGLSQRPAAVDKDFITQCDWIVWHRLTWNNDTAVVSSVLGGDAADTVSSLDVGEALLMTDWDEELRRVQFRPKRSADIGATPDLSRFEDESLSSAQRPHAEGPTAGENGEGEATDASTGRGPTRDRRDVMVPDEIIGDAGEEGPRATRSRDYSTLPGPPETTEGEEDGENAEYDLAWEVAHLVVYLVGVLKRSVWTAVFAVERSLWHLLNHPQPARRHYRSNRSGKRAAIVRLVSIAIVALLGLTVASLVLVLAGIV